jgi:hypothetical protein
MRMRSTVFLALVTALLGASLAVSTAAQTLHQLRDPGSFSGIADRATRSRAMFAEVAKVLTGPRCMNCHPAGDHPLQGMTITFINRQPHVALTTMASRGCLAPRAILIAISPFRSAKQDIRAYRGIRVGGWRQSRWRGKVSLWATSVGRSKIRHATGGEVLPCCMTT